MGTISEITNNPYLYSPTMMTFTNGINVINSSDSVTRLGSELNFLEESLDPKSISAVSGILSQDSSAPDIAALGEELSLLDSGTDNGSTADATGTSTPGSAPVLSYSYSPISGIITNTNNSSSSGSYIDTKL